MELNHFTKEDWDTYSGCHTEQPLIGWARGVTLLVDGNVVELYRDHPSPNLPDWALRFPDMGMAVMFALEFRGDEPEHIIERKAAKFGRVHEILE